MKNNPTREQKKKKKKGLNSKKNHIQKYKTHNGVPEEDKKPRT
jgi:hypothetical protein